MRPVNWSKENPPQSGWYQYEHEGAESIAYYSEEEKGWFKFAVVGDLRAKTEVKVTSWCYADDATRNYIRESEGGRNAVIPQDVGLRAKYLGPADLLDIELAKAKARGAYEGSKHLLLAPEKVSDYEVHIRSVQFKMPDFRSGESAHSIFDNLEMLRFYFMDLGWPYCRYDLQYGTRPDGDGAMKVSFVLILSLLRENLGPTGPMGMPGEDCKCKCECEGDEE